MKTCRKCGENSGKITDGLSVSWWDDVPEGAQVYIEWVPLVLAVWEEQGLQVE